MTGRNITQKAVAEYLGRSTGYVSEHLSGTRPPDTDMLDAVADLADVDGLWLLGLLRERLKETEAPVARQRVEESGDEAAARIVETARTQVSERREADADRVEVKPTRRKRGGPA